jgi:Mg-chelatase subunit ChlD
MIGERISKRSITILATVASLAVTIEWTSAAPPLQVDPTAAATYRLEDTWTRRPWALTAGRYGHAGDISSAGTSRHVLDTRHQAIHLLDEAGRPRGVFRLPPPMNANPGDTWNAVRLDTASDGAIAVLSLAPPGRNLGFAHVGLFDEVGRELGGFEITAQNGHFTDVAAAHNGAIYVTRAPLSGLFGGGAGNLGVDVYSRDGRLVAVIEDPAHLTYPDGVDVDADGTVYVINRTTVPSAEPGPGPTATPYPSFSGPGLGSPFQPNQATQAPIEGIVIYGSDHAFRDQVPFVSAEDVAAGPAGVYVSRHLEIFRLRETEPLFSGATGRVYAAYFGRAAIHLDVPSNGQLVAGLAHCYHQGVMMFADPSLRPGRYVLAGQTDSPELEGPAYPIRIAADSWVGALGGRFSIYGRPGPNRIYSAEQYARELQTVQRWGLDGSLTSQLGVCSGGESFWARDIAIDGDTVYTIDPVIVQARPGDGFPEWRFWPGELRLPLDISRLAAIGADNGEVAVLDQGAGSVVVLDAAGRLRHDWSWRSAINGLPSDLALHAGEVFLTETGERRVYRFSVTGELLGSFFVHDAPIAVDVGPDGRVYVLGRTGWGLRYSVNGDLEAAWRMPDREVQAKDIAVASDGKVRVNFYRLYQGGPDAFEIVDAGIWVFGAVETSVPPPAAPDACLAVPDKWAFPPTLPLGDRVDVTLTVDGSCPGSHSPVQVALVLDVSRSMNWEDARERAIEAGVGLLDRLDPQAAEVALVTFGDGAGVAVPMTRDFGAVVAAITGSDAWGDTQLGAGLIAAGAELARVEAAGVRQVAIVLSDGAPKDDPMDAALELAAGGVEAYFLAFPTREWNDALEGVLHAITGDPARVFVSPVESDLDVVTADATVFVPELGLFESIEVRDVIPENMAYMDGSASPPGTLEGDTLVWRFPVTAAGERLRMTYRLQPMETGTWPTNVRADADFVDALGARGTLEFPVPIVRVWDRSSLNFKVYLPLTANRACLESGTPVDVVLVLDASVSMADPTPGGGTKLEAARLAARRFLEILDPTDRASIVIFHDEATTLSGLTADRRVLIAALEQIEVSPGTLIDTGLHAAADVLESEARSDAQRAVILLTDGRHNLEPVGVLRAADRLKSAGVLLFAIGLGSDIDRDLLRESATVPEYYYEAPEADELEAIYQEIADWLPCARP